MKNGQNTTIFIVGFLAILSLMTVSVLATSDVPYGIRSIDYIQSSRPNISAYIPANLSTEAGNVTEINLTAITTSKAWAGYYGNITGVITLEDSYGYVFYNWSALNPRGEIYASTNSSITWASIACFNFTDASSINVTTAETWYNMSNYDEDGLNETFATTTNTAFQVGSVPITVNTCPTTQAYVYGNMKLPGNFENILLSDGASLVFTTIIENRDSINRTKKTGFDNRPHDFQLLVAQNGHDGFEDGTTPYYFWADIEG